MYPIKFEPIYKQMIWGGKRMKELYDREIPSETTGESWDLSCRKNEMGIVRNGDLARKTMIELINENSEFYLGKNISENQDFPLLIKIIDAKSNLSIQVHPDDKYAQKIENYPYGKSEMWYILDAPENGYLYIGLAENTDKNEFRKSLETGECEKFLCKLPIKKGDVIDIPAGMIHAITADVMVAEVQQNSDITYRIYDYKRKDANGNERELHIEKSMDTIDFSGKAKQKPINGLNVQKDGNIINYCIANKYYAVERYFVDESLVDKTDGEKFLAFTCVEGTAVFIYNDTKTEVYKSETVFIPAGLGEFIIEGEAELLKSYVPNIEKDFVKPLIDAGFTEEEILANTSLNDYLF